MYIVVDTVYTGWYVYGVEYYVMMTILHYTRQNLYTIHYTVIKRDRTLKSCNQSVLKTKNTSIFAGNTH